MKLPAGMSSVMRLIHWDDIGARAAKYWREQRTCRGGPRCATLSIFYIGAIGSGALSPILFGRAGDAVGVGTALLVVDMGSCI